MAARLNKLTLGVGHRIVDKAIDQALNMTACIASVTEKIIEGPILVFQVRDKLTTEDVHVKKVILGIRIEPGDSQSISLLKDWELLNILNEVSEGKGIRFSKEVAPSREAEKIKSSLPGALNEVNSALNKIDVPFKLPDVELLAVICPTI